MNKPESMKLDPDRNYSFKSPLKTFAVQQIDSLGSFFFPRSVEPIPWNRIKRLAVLRLDHLGDVLLALPALKALEESLPKAQIDLFLGPWAKDIPGLARLRCNVKIFYAPWFSRVKTNEGNWRSIRHLERVLREGAYDAAIELRGDFRHILAMANTGIKYRVGLARTGLGFLLTHRLEYQPGQHEIERNLESLRQMGIEISRKAKFPQLYPRKIDDLNQKKVRKKLGITHPVLAVHATCFALAKRWPIASWAQLLDKLPKKIDVVLIGAESEKTDMETIQKACRRKIFLTAGLLSLPELTAFLKKSKLFIGVDSGPAHIAAAVGIPVLSLYSGTNQKEQWGPMGSKVTVIQKKPACSPCERLVCPIGNECMNLIRVDEVLKQVERILNN